MVGSLWNLGKFWSDNGDKKVRQTRWYLLALLAGVLLGLGGVWWYGRENLGWKHPWGEWFVNEKAGKMRVVGFLPTWMVGKTGDYCDKLTDVVYLGVEVNSKGEIVDNADWKKFNSSTYREYANKLRKCGVREIVGIKQFDDEKLNELFSSQEAVTTLIEGIKRMEKEYGVMGVNVDFEFQNNPLGVLSPEFVGFLGELKRAEIGEISVDVFANTLIKGETERLKALLLSVDYVLVMAYDFSRPGGDLAGPVAPMEAEAGRRHIGEVYDKVVASQLDPKKIVMAYPLYGYEWKTVGEDFRSETVAGWGQTATIARVGKILQDTRYKIYDLRFKNEAEATESAKLNNLEMRVEFDEQSVSPWLVWREDVTKTITQIVNKKRVKKQIMVPEYRQTYFEDERSLRYKIEMAENNQVLGVGFWALGYEGEEKWVWEIFDDLYKDEG